MHTVAALPYYKKSNQSSVMRSDRYDSHHTSANTSNYLLKTATLFCSTLFSGANLFTFILYRCKGDNELLFVGITLLIVSVLMSFIHVFDNRIGLKKFPYIIAWIAIYLISVIVLFIIGLTALLVMTIEIILYLLVLFIIKQLRKNREK